MGASCERSLNGSIALPILTQVISRGTLRLRSIAMAPMWHAFVQGDPLSLDDICVQSDEADMGMSYDDL